MSPEDRTSSERSEEPEFSVVIGAFDTFLRRALEETVATHPDFRSVVSVANAIQTVEVARTCHVDAVILVDESPGLKGREVLDQLAAVSPEVRVLIMSTGDLDVLVSHPNVSTASASGDFTSVANGLTSLARWLSNPSPAAIDRRGRVDRRLSQDWSKTFAQRRHSGRRLPAELVMSTP